MGPAHIKVIPETYLLSLGHRLNKCGKIGISEYVPLSVLF